MFGSLIIAYLFLGGAGGGMVALLSAYALARGLGLGGAARTSGAGRRPRRDGPRRRGAGRLASPALPSPAPCPPPSLFARGYAVASAALALGVLCLLGDLGRPERFLYVLLHPTASVLTFGSVVLGCTLACSVALAAVHLVRGGRVPRALARTLEAASALCGLATAVYTGVLLAQIGSVALWNPLVAPLFALSSLSVGAAGMLGCLLPLDEAPPRIVRALARLDSAAVALEALCFAAYLAWAAWVDGRADLVAELLDGPGAGTVWAGFAAPGIAAPLALEAAYARTRRTDLLTAAIPLVVVGGIFLRHCIVNVPLG